MLSDEVDFHLEAFDYVIGKITDGFVFERFAQGASLFGHRDRLCPLGGVKDDQRTIYQISIEADSRAKIFRSLASLAKRGVECGRFFYVTNRQVRAQDKLMEDVYRKYGVQLNCRDIAWLRGNIGSSEGTLRLYADLLRNNIHSLPVRLLAVVERCTRSIQWRRIDVGDGRFGITKEIV